MYLAACTKGANASSVRQQPFSSVLAKQRAYSLKSSYMTQILNKYIFGNVESERIIKSWQSLHTSSFEECVVEKLTPFYGKTLSWLMDTFQVNSKAKNIIELILAKMLGVEGRVTHAEEFRKAGIVPKTIRVQHNGKIKESMSFPNFDFIELSKETEWEDSDLYMCLAPTKFLFVIFQEQEDGEYVFDRAMFWNIPYDDLEEVRTVWERTIATICEGVQLIPTAQGVSNNLPKMTENHVAHVRPHGKNAADKLPLPDGRMMTKQCFWLNSSYIAEQIKEK